jgi:DNA-binding transcriptional ArsR family regulator
MNEPRQISDPQTMRAMAHPVRLALLDLIRRDGEITATRAAEQLGESPGNMSWHLQTLAKYGFVEEAEGGKGRSRPWKIASRSNRFSIDGDDPTAAAAENALVLQVVDRNYEYAREWLAARRGYASEWQKAAFIANSIVYMTADELDALSREISEIYARHIDRADKRNRPEGALPVRLTAQGHPLPPTEAGN